MSSAPQQQVEVRPDAHPCREGAWCVIVRRSGRIRYFALRESRREVDEIAARYRQGARRE